VLIKIDYSTKIGEIIIGVNASLEGYRGYLGQKDIKFRKVCPIYYKSGIWLQAERKYNAIKRECKGVLKILKKLQPFLIRCHFILKTDANMLVAQLNRAATNHPRALVI
jgi:RNase H-like domain found in reverse transcriptase